MRTWTDRRAEKYSYGLIPCPFCGVASTDVGVILHTDDCYLMLKYMGAKKEKLIKAWNTRPEEEALRTENARLKSEPIEGGTYENMDS